MKVLRVLDLCSGLEGWSEPFRERGHHVTSLDIDPRFSPDLVADVMADDIFDVLRSFGPFDLILASPPCEKFSTLSFQRGYFTRRVWANDVTYHASSDEGWNALCLVQRIVEIIRELRPRAWTLENPRALLRMLDVVPHHPHTVWYCHLGEPVAKPTDLWGAGLPSLVFPPECHNRRPTHPDDCCCHDHIAAPRGSRTGTQGVRGGHKTATAAERAKIPRALATLVMDAAERDLV